MDDSMLATMKDAAICDMQHYLRAFEICCFLECLLHLQEFLKDDMCQRVVIYNIVQVDRNINT